jgi:hypothetical protein
MIFGGVKGGGEEEEEEEMVLVMLMIMMVMNICVICIHVDRDGKYVRNKIIQM